ncbi:hypothetical protein J6590_018505 [Homalodisca vitripennis]|nr:hypothetical protein J6590_018505 [Homalodisca vitripennis]
MLGIPLNPLPWCAVRMRHNQTRLPIPFHQCHSDQKLKLHQRHGLPQRQSHLVHLQLSEKKMSRKEDISFGCTSSSGQGYSVQPHDAQAEASDRFKQPTSSFNLKSSEKCVYDSRLSDSGVWSGSNIHSEEILNTPESPVSKSSDFTYSSEKVLGDKASYMRLDSGIDVNSVSQNLSELSVKDAESYNDLNDPSSKTKGPTTNINEQFTSGQKTLETPVHKLPLLERFEQNEDGDTQLHLAIIHKFIEAVYALVRMVPHPKYLNIKNEDRQTALHLAVLTREPRLVRLLVCAGASSAELDRQGNTALHLAVQADDLNSVRAIIDPITTPEILEAHLQYTPFHVHREIANVHNYEEPLTLAAGKCSMGNPNSSQQDNHLHLAVTNVRDREYSLG